MKEYMSNFEFITYNNDQSKEISDQIWNSNRGPHDFITSLKKVNNNVINDPTLLLKKKISQHVQDSLRLEKQFYSLLNIDGYQNIKTDCENGIVEYPNNFMDNLLSSLYKGKEALFKTLHSKTFRKNFMEGVNPKLQNLVKLRCREITKGAPLPKFDLKKAQIIPLGKAVVEGVEIVDDSFDFESLFDPLLQDIKDIPELKDDYDNFINTYREFYNNAMANTAYLSMDTEDYLKMQELVKVKVLNLLNGNVKALENRQYIEENFGAALAGFLFAPLQKGNTQKISKSNRPIFSVNIDGETPLQILQKEKNQSPEEFLNFIIPIKADKFKIVEEGVDKLFQKASEFKKEAESGIREYNFEVSNDLSPDDAYQAVINGARVALSGEALTQFNEIIDQAAPEIMSGIKEACQQIAKNQFELNNTRKKFKIPSMIEREGLIEQAKTGNKKDLVNALNEAINELLKSTSSSGNKRLVEVKKGKEYGKIKKGKSSDPKKQEYTFTFLKPDEGMDVVTLQEITELLDKTIENVTNGYVNPKIGDFSEAFFTILISILLKNIGRGTASQLGSEHNLESEQMHADVSYSLDNDNVGFQLKEYLSMNGATTLTSTFSFYEDNIANFPITKTIKNEDNSLYGEKINRYIKQEYVAAFNFIVMNSHYSPYGEKFFDTENEKYFMNNILFPFMRYEDYALVNTQYENLKNNFYVVSGYLVPTSLILFCAYQQIEGKENGVRGVTSIGSIKRKEAKFLGYPDDNYKGDIDNVYEYYLKNTKLSYVFDNNFVIDMQQIYNYMQNIQKGKIKEG